MKRVQLIEWGLVTIGLIFGYKFFEGVFSLVSQLIFQFDRGSLGYGLFLIIILCVLYFVAFIVIIRESPKIAQKINGNSPNDTLPIKITRQSLIQVVLIGIAMATVISKAGNVLIYLFELFKNKASNSGYDSGNYFLKERFMQEAAQTIFALVALFFSKDISGWFINSKEPEQFTFESEPEKDE